MTLLNGTAESLERQRAAIDDLNQKLSQSQKMEAMGQLTGGVAHDFNNLLTVILGNAEYLAEQLAANKELHEIADSIATAAERGSELTRSLLAFARKQPLMPKDIDIGQKILDMEQLLRRTLGEHIECEFLLDPDLWLASVDPGQLASALLNLVLNARDAMPQGGKLTVEVRNISLGESDLDVNGEARPGDYVMVAVTRYRQRHDRRGGRPRLRAVLHHQGGGQRHGLGPQHGLRVCPAIRRLDANPLRARSMAPPSSFSFPVLGCRRRMQRAAGQIAMPAGSETILVVEDDDMVRAYIEKELKALGYHVIVARERTRGTRDIAPVRAKSTFCSPMS